MQASSWLNSRVLRQAVGPQPCRYDEHVCVYVCAPAFAGVVCCYQDSSLDLHLHNSGGRNAAFAAWAGGVGCVYGAAYLYTHNIWVPAAAHALANFASAAVWKSRNAGLKA